MPAVATSSALAAAAAAEIASLGGNAVDCAIAASLVSINTQPGVCALAGSAYVTVWPAGGEPVTIDGNVAIPGIGATRSAADIDAESVEMSYGGGIRTVVGSPSVAVPGTPAALAAAAERYGTLAWADLLAPSIRATRDGFPLPPACTYYLKFSGDKIYGRSPEGYAALHDTDGALLRTGDPVIVPGLADTLEQLAREGVRDFYEGEIARRIVEHIQAGGGLLNAEDMRQYRAIPRPCLTADIGDWAIATNPPPAVGGAVLLAMLECFGKGPIDRWTSAETTRLAATHAAVLDFRKRHLDLADSRTEAAERLLAQAKNGELLKHPLSSATVHTSAVDAEGLGCSITASSGYGSGEIPPGSGLWLNNCLGELELNRRGLSAGPAGARLPSNMTPTICRRDGATIALGSPGADRITSALHQFIVHALQRGLALSDAIATPRLHVDMTGDAPRLMLEPDIPLPESTFRNESFESQSMYFGGVAAASFNRDTGFEAAADQRREGGVFVSVGDAV